MKAFLHSLVAAAIGGFAGVLGDVLVSPSGIPHDKSGWLNLLKAAVIGAIVPVLTLLKQSPLNKPSNTN